MRLASALSERARVADAFDEAADRISERLGRNPDVLFVFASTRLRGDVTELPRRASARFASPLVCGSTGEGVLAAGVERERAPALALLGISLPTGARARPLRAEPGARRIEVGPRPTGIALFPEPFGADVAAMLRALDGSCRSPIVGAIASGARRPSEHALFLEGWTFTGGAVGVAFSGAMRIDTVVAQACRPIGEPMIVTRADGPRIVELDRGRPLDVLRELHASLDERDRMLLRAGLFCGVQMHDSQIEYGPGDFLVHDVVGVERGALVVSSRLEGYPAVQLHVRDPQASLESLSRALDAEHAAGGETSGALLFACRRRGVRLYGETNRDSRAFTERFGDVPLAGFFANGVIAPSRGSTHVHHHAASIALFRKASPTSARASRGAKPGAKTTAPTA